MGLIRARGADVPVRLRIRLLLVGVFAAVGATAACHGSPPDTAEIEPERERSVEPVRWDTVFTIGGEVEDTLLSRPRLIAAGGGMLYAYDLYDGRLLAFDAAGDLRWSYGRQTEYERRMVDEHSAENCRYLRTLHPPRVLQAMAWDDGTFCFYHEEPAPTLLALRPVFA